MKRATIVLMSVFFTFGLELTVFADDVIAQNTPNNLEDDRRLDEEAKIRELRDDVREEERARDLEALREARPSSTEVTLDPSSVELVVELDPNGYGFRTRNHRMTMSADIDLLLRGRAMLHYDYRFFNYFSMGLLFGVDWTDVSLYSRFRQHLNKPTPRQFAILGGVSGKWRLTEWYMKSSLFLEPSLLFGHMWQSLSSQKTTHWRIRPGIFGGVETVFDSGLSLVVRAGVEFPVDFAKRNAFKEIAEPVFAVGFGFAI